jgi:hypothetical protein
MIRFTLMQCMFYGFMIYDFSSVPTPRNPNPRMRSSFQAYQVFLRFDDD